jgi:hypothetical protein
MMIVRFMIWLIIQADVSSEATELTIYYIMNKYGFNHLTTPVAAVNGWVHSFVFRSYCLIILITKFTTIILYRPSSNFNIHGMEAFNQLKSNQKLVPFVMETLEKVLQLSSSQILKAYERFAEGMKLKLR